MHLSLYNDVVVFDQATKLIYVISWVHLDSETTTPTSADSHGSNNSDSRSEQALRDAYEEGKRRLQRTVHLLSSPPPSLAPAQVDMSLSTLPAPPGKSNMTKQQFLDAVMAAKEYILVRVDQQSLALDSCLSGGLPMQPVSVLLCCCFAFCHHMCRQL